MTQTSATGAEVGDDQTSPELSSQTSPELSPKASTRTGAHLWRGVIREYADRLPSLQGAPVVTLGEGGTPLIQAAFLSALVGADVFIKYEGVNPTGSFKDRGMTTAISVAARRGAKAVICASTGNTSASAAAYATKAGMTCGVLVPDGKIAMGKLSQAIAHGATLLQVDGNFDDCLTLARKLAEAYPVELVNSVNPARIEGQKTASFEIVDVLGDAPDIHCLPVGNAGNITAYWRGYREYHRDSAQPGPATRLPRMWGFQAEGAAPIVAGHPIDHPETIATAIRIGNPASWRQAEEARDESGGLIDAVSDAQILSAHRLLSAKEGIFVEPASAASVAGLLAAHAAGLVPTGARIVCTVTGHGLKDPGWALKNADGVEVVPTRVSVDAHTAASALGLAD
jgi:threonine synthase